jgi:dTDP-glucose 4,6-dehydratase
MNSNKISREMGWKSKTSFEHGIHNTIDWYLNHEEAWKDLTPSTLSPTPWKN